MGEFFHGWRRKAGCVLLVMALVVTGAWIRSYSIKDRLHFEHGEPGTVMSEGIKSAEGNLTWERYSELDQIVRKVKWTSEEVKSSLSSSSDRQYEPQWKWCGMEFGRVKLGSPPFTLCFGWLVIPFWSISVPLTILSGYLILWPGKRLTKLTHP